MTGSQPGSSPSTTSSTGTTGSTRASGALGGARTADLRGACAPGAAGTCLSTSDKYALVCQLRRLGAGGRPLGSHVKTIANMYGVSDKTVYRWLKDPKFTGDQPPAAAGRRRFEVGIEHLTVLADEQNALSAWQKMHEAGLLNCSYPTFARALAQRTDPALVAAALDGMKGLVNNRLYLSYVPPHRCHTYHLDHTELDLWVWPSHKHRSPIRPQVTVVVDGHSALLHAVPWSGPVNGDMVAAALAESAVDRTYLGVQIGGQPEQIVIDNAAAHYGPAMRAAAARMGWIPAPTAAYSSWQNGKAERAIGLLNERLANRAPGATNAGTTRTGASRHAAADPDKINPDEVWTWRAFTQALQAVVDEINSSISVDRLGKQTRLQAWANDPTARRALSLAEARLVMLPSAKGMHRASKSGIQFENRHYVGAFIEVGRQYQIRYLPTQRDFIEVFDATGEHLGTAYEAQSMPKSARDDLMASRARQERDALAIEHGVQAHRRHQAAVDNANAAYLDAEAANTIALRSTTKKRKRPTIEPATEAVPQPILGDPDPAGLDEPLDTEPNSAPDFTDVVDTPTSAIPTAPAPSLPPAPAPRTGAVTDRMRRAHGEHAPERSRRGRLPRVPIEDATRTVDQDAADSLTSRLDALYATPATDHSNTGPFTPDPNRTTD